VDSAAYQQLYQLAQIGASDSFAPERLVLSSQPNLFGYSTSGLFSDANSDALKQWNNTYQVSTRALGGGQAVLGGLGVAGSVLTAPASCATGMGCFANAAVGVMSVDAMYAGSKQLVSGNPESTFLNQGLQGLGMSPDVAAYLEFAFGVGAAAKVGSIVQNSSAVLDFGGSASRGRGATAIDDVVAGKGASGGVGATEGLAFRTDLPSHMIGPDGFTKSGQLSGTHNLTNATSSLDTVGATYTLQPTGTVGVYELPYTYTNPATGKVVSGSKTVYDPAVFSDQTMLNNAQQAGQQAWTQYLQNPTVKVIDGSVGGVNFRSYINVDKNGNAFIGNVHPIK